MNKVGSLGIPKENETPSETGSAGTFGDLRNCAETPQRRHVVEVREGSGQYFWQVSETFGGSSEYQRLVRFSSQSNTIAGLCAVVSSYVSVIVAGKQALYIF
jgi:hypothetical protein